MVQASLISRPRRVRARASARGGLAIEVRVADLDAPAHQILSDLSEDERERAARFRFDRDRRRFVAARSILRRLLGEKLGIAPDEIAFAYSSHGKPAVPGSPVEFNVSHSGGVGLFAFSPGPEIGVDVELLGHERADDELVARRFFSPREVEALRRYPQSLRAEAFLRCWTRKEAFVKARGDGLSLPLHEFDVSLSGGEAALLRTGWAPAERLEWRLFDVSRVPDGWVAAVAIRAEGADVRVGEVAA